MRSREQVTEDILTVARSTNPDKYPLRQLKAELLAVELLIDIRDLLVEIRDRSYVVDFAPPDYGKEDKLS